MKYSHKIEKAIRKASLLHRGQLRKGDGSTPFIEHPFAVVLILSEFTDDENIIITGILHDTIEDTYYSYEELEKDFGSEIMNMVKSLTESKKSDKKSMSWLERKQKYLSSMRKMTEAELIVSAADKIHNLSSLVYDYEIMGKNLWNKFNAPADKCFWFYDETFKIFHERLNHEIVKEFDKKLEQAKKVFKISK